MFYYKKYVRAKDLEEAYTLCQKRSNVIMGGMLWLKMENRNISTAIDLVDLHLNKIEESEDCFRIGAYVTLRDLENHEALNRYTGGAVRDAVKDIVGVQFRNVATVGGSIWGRFGFSDVLTVFRALGAKVELYKEGILSLDEFVSMSRTKRDVLVSVIVPKITEKIVYLSQRNTRTDFPVLTCAVAKRTDGYVAAIGAYPHMAVTIFDEKDLLKEDPKAGAKSFGEYVAGQITFGSNLRAGAAYRKIICEVLTKRAVERLAEKKEDSSWK